MQFWRDWLNKDHIWSEFTCSLVYDELIQRVLEDLESLNLTYKVEKGFENQNEMEAGNA